jgi:hypothetical protein
MKLTHLALGSPNPLNITNLNVPTLHNSNILSYTTTAENTCSLSISNHPSASFNWADDDEDDDWNLEHWKASADTSAPTSLPPLQVLQPKTDDEDTFYTVYKYKSANEAAPWISAPAKAYPEPQKQDPSTIDRRCGNKELVWRAVWTDNVDVPAYPELSGWDNGMLCMYKRVNYSQHFQAMKLENGCCGAHYRPFQCRVSKMRDVVYAETKEVVELTPATADIAPSTENTVAEAEIVCPAEPAPEANEDVESISDVPSLSSSSSLSGADTVPIQDEGYYSEDSPPISPTVESFSKADNALWNIAQIGISPATSFVKKYPRADVDCPRDVLPLGDLVFSKGVFTQISDALASSWLFASAAPWTTIGTIAAGAALGGAFHFARRR